MGRGKHKPWSYGLKKAAYKTRKAQPNYPRGGFGIAKPPYAKPKRKSD